MIAEYRLDSSKLSIRQKTILSGLYLSKYNIAGVKALGFDSFVEAFNVIGFALGSRPASIKNYRDEFDPLFPNVRKGWHKRALRDHLVEMLNLYNDLDFESFTGLVGSFFGNYEGDSIDLSGGDTQAASASSFAQRLITGLAAERYFESKHAVLPEFKGYQIENTTRLGCGYDYRMRAETQPEDYLAIEVKGLKDKTGSLLMTPKEFEAASALKNRFFLFVVRNFRESPDHTIFQDPTSSSLKFRKVERTVIQTTWLTNI
jgi:hypothetical protein